MVHGPLGGGAYLWFQGAARGAKRSHPAAHLVGPHVDEVIDLFALAIRHNLTADDLKRTMFAYPSGASDIGYML